MKIGLIFTNDWELYGDGSGDYFEIQHQPLKNLLEVMESHQAKMTVMAEVGQQWSFQRNMEKVPRAQEISKAWESAVQDAVRRGHDVQLHLHPQWLNAVFSDNQWKVDLTQWSTGSMNPAEMARVFQAGKTYLESLLKPVNPRYECIGFRAGAYCIEPSETVIGRLLEAGIRCDSSVTKGFSKLPYYDYRNAYSNTLPWHADSRNIARQGESRLMEFPIHSFSRHFPAFFERFLPKTILYGARITLNDKKWLVQQKEHMTKQYPPNRRPATSASNLSTLSLNKWFSALRKRSHLQLDYDTLPCSVFVKAISNILQDKKLQQIAGAGSIIPVMASGHVKAMPSCDNVHRILTELKQRFDDQIIFWTWTDAMAYMFKQDHAI